MSEWRRSKFLRPKRRNKILGAATGTVERERGWGRGQRTYLLSLRRGAPPGEVAEAVFALAKSGFLTGEVVILSGGAFMRP